jgi:hypothetical protein
MVYFRAKNVAFVFLSVIKCMFLCFIVVTIGPKGSLASKLHLNRALSPHPDPSYFQALPSNGIQFLPQHVNQQVKARTCLVSIMPSGNDSFSINTEHKVSLG